jgi:hypothetical protein
MISHRGIDAPAPPGFLADTPILTQSGYRSIATLQPGDKVITADGKVVPVDHVKAVCCDVGEKTLPYKIPRGAIKAKKDIYISPHQRVTYNDGTLHEARKLGLTQIDMSDEVVYYNVVLDMADIRNILAAGVEVEPMSTLTRVDLSKEEFYTLMRERYGSRPSDEIIQSIFKACKMLPNNRVEVPAFLL